MMICRPPGPIHFSPSLVTSTGTSRMYLRSLMSDLAQSLSPRISNLQSEVPLLLSMCHKGDASIALRTTSAFIAASCPHAVTLPLAMASNIIQIALPVILAISLCKSYIASNVTSDNLCVNLQNDPSTQACDIVRQMAGMAMKVAGGARLVRRI